MYILENAEIDKRSEERGRLLGGSDEERLCIGRCLRFVLRVSQKACGNLALPAPWTNLRCRLQKVSFDVQQLCRVFRDSAGCCRHRFFCQKKLGALLASFVLVLRAGLSIDCCTYKMFLCQSFVPWVMRKLQKLLSVHSKYQNESVVFE